jgi:hypothetical protein
MLQARQGVSAKPRQRIRGASQQEAQRRMAKKDVVKTEKENSLTASLVELRYYPADLLLFNRAEAIFILALKRPESTSYH